MQHPQANARGSPWSVRTRKHRPLGPAGLETNTNCWAAFAWRIDRDRRNRYHRAGYGDLEGVAAVWSRRAQAVGHPLVTECIGVYRIAARTVNLGCWGRVRTCEDGVPRIASIAHRRDAGATAEFMARRISNPTDGFTMIAVAS